MSTSDPYPAERCPAADVAGRDRTVQADGTARARSRTTAHRKRSLLAALR